MATATAKGMRIRPSIEALAMADVDCAFNDDDDDDQDAPPPEHLRAFEAFIETWVVPLDKVLAFEHEQSAKARRQGHRREDDVKEKLELWAKAVAAKARRQYIIKHDNQNVCVHHV
ncbi:uncharacterized protein [Zea mays]|uniref:uncharacterized protein n=1 Tax=Zea mays TaxID=4577 RepID=UPI0009AA1AA5|nr:uncharacterized protein LOC109944347 [Zea mays]|eukprot:XP_020404667.1 uncharacterized protein LOC109944347 [Zea mays]